MRVSRSLMFLFLLVGYCGNLLSQTPAATDPEVSSYLGKWRFISKESFKGESDRKLFTAYVISIERLEDKLRITREFVYNSVAYSSEAVMYLDGRGETNSLTDSDGKISIVQSKSRLKKGSIFREFASETRAVPADTETFRISDDGTRLIVERSYRLKIRGWAPRHLMDRVESDRVVLERVE